MATVDFYFDFLSPFSYLAHHRLKRIARETGARIDFHAIDLAVAKKAAGNTGPGTRDMPVKLAYAKRDLARWVAEYGVPFAWVGNYASRSLNIGHSFARARGREADYVEAGFRAGWGEGGTLDDPALLRRVATAAGLDVDALLRHIESPEGARAYEAETAAAITRGVFGVPSMMIGDELWWGNDRLFWVERALRTPA
jgi:2-hydroxychromene-2-carboxylate isomerase